MSDPIPSLEKADVSELLAKVVTKPKVDTVETPVTPVSELVSEPVKPTVPVPEAQPISELLNENGPTVQNSSEPIQPQSPQSKFVKKDRYKLEDYLSLDWNKSNAELAVETGKTEVYMSQVRWKVKAYQATGTKSPPDFSDVIPTPEKAAIDYQLMAQTVFDMSTGTLSMVLGPEWQPKDAQERDVMVMSLKAYLTAKQVQDLPPGVILTFVCMAYAAPRFQAPPTRAKIKGLWGWCKDKLSKLRRKKPAMIAVLPKREITPEVESGK